MRRVSVRVPRYIRLKLDDLKRENSITHSSIIRRAIDSYRKRIFHPRRRLRRIHEMSVRLGLRKSHEVGATITEEQYNFLVGEARKLKLPLLATLRLILMWWLEEQK